MTIPRQYGLNACNDEWSEENKNEKRLHECTPFVFKQLPFCFFVLKVDVEVWEGVVVVVVLFLFLIILVSYRTCMNRRICMNQCFGILDTTLLLNCRASVLAWLGGSRGLREEAAKAAKETKEAKKRGRQKKSDCCGIGAYSRTACSDVIFWILSCEKVKKGACSIWNHHRCDPGTQTRA